MSGFGSISGMIISLKGNKALVPRKKTMKDLSTEFSKPSINNEPLRYEVRISIAERNMKLIELRERKRKSEIRLIVICLIILAGTCGAVFLFNWL